MSELMTDAIIGMPIELAMQSKLSQEQFYLRAQAVLAENATLKNEVQRITELRRVEWANAQQVEAENKRLSASVKLNLCDYPAIHAGDVDLLIASIEGVSQVELAKRHNCTPPNIGRKIRRIKDRLGWRRGMSVADILARAEHLQELAKKGAVVSADVLEERDQLLAENKKLRSALAEAANSIECETLQKYCGQSPDEMHPVTRRYYDRDMAEVNGFRAMSADPAAPGVTYITISQPNVTNASEASQATKELRQMLGLPPKEPRP